MVTRRLAGRLAGSRAVPTSLQAILGYYADSGVFDRAALSLKRETDDRIERMVTDVFATVEDALAAEFGRETVEFSYDTKLLLPAQLTLGYVYREAGRSASEDPVADDIADGIPEVTAATLVGDGATTAADEWSAVGEEATSGIESALEPRARVVRTERMTRLAVEALLDGDMRDAINDGEYADFEVDFPTDEADRRRVAEVAQATLQESLLDKLDRLPDVVADTYETTVDYSESHQERDEQFRELMRSARDGDADATDAIREEYRDAPYEEPPAIFDETERSLPYSKTQYARVGVLYDTMLELYRVADLGIDRRFSKAIVLSIVGAQIWLDDVDDYEDDRREGQLTPVTAEYLLADDERRAYENVVDTTGRYLDLAQEHATAADSALTGIAIEYIYRSGTPEVLPGRE